MDALRECVRMITTSTGGCTTAFPFEAAIWMLEEQEELYGGTFPVHSGEVAAAGPCIILRQCSRAGNKPPFDTCSQNWSAENSVYKCTQPETAQPVFGLFSMRTAALVCL